MNCPFCGGNMKVINSRKRVYPYRRRECVACGERLTTYEVSQLTLLDIFDEYMSDEQVDEIAFVLEKELPEAGASKRNGGARV